MGEAVREIAVVREQQHTARVDVEPADGHDPCVVPDEIDDGRTPLRVARGRHDPERLVEQDVCELLLPDPLAVDLDHVARGDERVQLAAAAR